MLTKTEYEQLHRTLRDALETADQLGLCMVACHIDHALALVDGAPEREFLTTSPSTTSLM